MYYNRLQRFLQPTVRCLPCSNIIRKSIIPRPCGDIKLAPRSCVDRSRYIRAGQLLLFKEKEKKRGGSERTSGVTWFSTGTAEKVPGRPRRLTAAVFYCMHGPLFIISLCTSTTPHDIRFFFFKKIPLPTVSAARTTTVVEVCAWLATDGVLY